MGAFRWEDRLLLVSLGLVGFAGGVVLWRSAERIAAYNRRVGWKRFDMVSPRWWRFSGLVWMAGGAVGVAFGLLVT